MRAGWSERELEDWLWEHPEALGFDHPSVEPFRWLARQVGLPDNTTLDLLGILPGPIPSLVVAELKAVEADGRALAQLMSYMEVLYCSIGMRCEYYLSDYIASYDDFCEEGAPISRLHEPWGVLVAPGFTRRTLLAARRTNVTCVEVRSQFRFYAPPLDYDPRRDDKWPNKMQIAMVDAVEEALCDGPLPNA